MRKLASVLFTGLFVLAALSLAPAPCHAGDCWGCHSFSCMQGFDAGGLFCEEVSLSCGFVYQLLGLDCQLRSCKTSGACPRSISEPDRSIDPSTIGNPS